MITATRLEFVKTDGEGVKWWRAVLTATEEPTSLEISGADADNVNDELGFAAGSVLIAPASNYIALEDGVFTMKSSGGGGGGGDLIGIESIRIGFDDTEVTGFFTFSPEMPYSWDGGEISIIANCADAVDGDYYVIVKPTSTCKLAYDDNGEWSWLAPGGTYDVMISMENGNAYVPELLLSDGNNEASVYISLTNISPK